MNIQSLKRVSKCAMQWIVFNPVWLSEHRLRIRIEGTIGSIPRTTVFESGCSCEKD